MTGVPVHLFGRRLPPGPAASTAPDWQQADPHWIAAALRSALVRPSGGWYAVAESRRLAAQPKRPMAVRVHGRDYILWREGEALHAARDRCPHLGASLAGAKLRAGCVICPWHGMELDARARGSWQPFAACDDGVLLWLQPPDGDEAATPWPLLSQRPARHFAAVMVKEARCEPADILANRLDPWHGVHYHPHSFAGLRVLEQRTDEITVRVIYRVGPRHGIEVDARFHCPDARTITMTIVAGEGEGSVVETHATPIESGRTLVLEAVLACSDRPQFWFAARGLGAALRPLVAWAARRLWREDAAYAERLYRLRAESTN